MNRRVALALMAVCLVLAALPGCSKRERSASQATSTTTSAAQGVGPFRVSIVNRPDRPIVGDNTFTVTVHDSAGEPVRGASVNVIVSMPSMGAMPRMESRGEFRETKAGTYEAKYGVQMQGDWDVALSIRAPDGRQAEAIYRLSTNTSDIAYVSGTPPAGGQAAGAGMAAGPDAGAISIDPTRRQSIGIRTAPVTKQDLTVTIRAAGRVTYDETRRAEISLKFSGWVRDIHVDYVGRQVSRGEVLFTVYSPELLSAQQEYLQALNASPQGADLAAAARQRLLLWDIAPSTLDAIVSSGKARESLPILAPVSGVVLEKNVVAGSSFMAGQTQ